MTSSLSRRNQREFISEKLSDIQEICPELYLDFVIEPVLQVRQWSALITTVIGSTDHSHFSTSLPRCASWRWCPREGSVLVSAIATLPLRSVIVWANHWAFTEVRHMMQKLRAKQLDLGELDRTDPNVIVSVLKVVSCKLSSRYSDLGDPHAIPRWNLPRRTLLVH